jgi:DNA-binding NarL/FixJ family response regulator
MAKTQSRKSAPPKPSPALVHPALQKKKVFVIDDHPILRQGMARLINDQPDLMVCGEADSPVEAMKALGAANPDVAIVDLTLRGGDGLELCKQIRDRFPVLSMLVVSMHEESLYAERALKAGARGYVMKQEPQETVITALRTVAKGDVYLSEKMSAKLLRSFSGSKSDSELAPLERLTDRELEIFRLIGDGQSVRAIAEKLFLSTKTVEAHKEHIKQKLNLKSSNELLQYAIEARPRT